MSIRVGTCSDINLEYKFRHMTRKISGAFQELLLEGWRGVIGEVVELELDFFIIAGNTFATPRPSNTVLFEVQEGLKKVAASGTNVAVLPGPRDTPLYTAGDIHPLKVLAANSDDIVFLGGEKKQPLFNLRNGRTVELHAPKSALLVSKDDIEELTTQEDAYSIFIFNGRLGDGNDSGRRVVDKSVVLDRADLETLEGHGIECLIVGGQHPPNHSWQREEESTLHILHAPPVHLTNFFVSLLDPNAISGLLSFEVSPSGGIVEQGTEFLAGYNIVSKEIDMTAGDPVRLNQELPALIRDHSGKNRAFQLHMRGKMDRHSHHKLNLHDCLRMGKLKNMYFELIDGVEYKGEDSDISGLSPQNELHRLLERDIADLPQGEAEIRRVALEMIMKDLSRDGE